jgi:uncharacterized protein (DUF305 family)
VSLLHRRPDRPPRRSRRWLAVVVAGPAVALAACSSPPPAVVVNSDALSVKGQVCCVATRADVVNGISTDYNGWDTAFISWITPHDAIASQMAALAPTQASSQQVKDIAAAIDDGTGARYLKVSAMALAWGQPVPSTDPNAAAGHDHGGGGNSEAATAATLIPLTGAAFDKTFLTIMVEHHQALLPIAKATIENGINAQDRQFAQDTLADQTAQISQLQELLVGL